MQKDGDYLKWLKSKQSVAEYFGYLYESDRKKSWKLIEVLFKETRLRHLFSNNGNVFKRDVLVDYELLCAKLRR